MVTRMGLPLLLLLGVVCVARPACAARSLLQTNVTKVRVGVWNAELFPLFYKQNGTIQGGVSRL